MAADKPVISAIGCYVPPGVLTNSDLEKMVQTNNDWIIDRTGISERHIASPEMATSDLATCAARAALAHRGIAAAELDAILVCTVTPDMLFPSTACLVQHNLGATKAWGFDLVAACSGFVYGLMTGASFIAAGIHRKVLVIGADTMSRIIDYEDRTTCVLFGDGAGAMLIEPGGNGNGAASAGLGFIDFIGEIDGSGGSYLKMPAGGSRMPASAETVQKKLHYVHQEGAQVFKYAVLKMHEVCSALLERNGHSASGEPAHYPRDRRAAGPPDGEGDDEHRAIRQYDSRNDSTRHPRRDRRRPPAQRRSGYVRCRGRRVHGRSKPLALGFLNRERSDEMLDRPVPERGIGLRMAGAATTEAAATE
jgi:3-oxoacyl-[acyl-carrier-protein] synthase III